MVPEEHELARRPVLQMADLRDMVLATPIREGNVKAFDLQYQPFFDAGVRQRHVPEGKLALYHYAVAERLFMLGNEGEHLAHGNLVQKTVLDCGSVVEAGVIRNKDDDREAVRKFWASARIVAEAANRASSSAAATLSWRLV